MQSRNDITLGIKQIILKYLPVLIVFLSMMGCSGDDGGSPSPKPCDREIKELIERKGDAEEIERLDEGDVHVHTYWYWTQGYAKSFTWSDAGDQCETSTYTFTPVDK